ncbi:MAG: HEPN domain-containing protein [Nitrospira sp.]|nr:HEPN domain-containing protein [Nitrospira sp.]
MEGRDFLNLAIKLQNAEDEAEHRTAVSRAYYAAFNHVKSFLYKCKIKLPKAAKAHVKAYQYLFNSGLDEAEDLAEILDNLRNYRNDADYELISPKYQHNKKNCHLVCFQAEQFFNRFDKVDSIILEKGIWEYKKRTNN